MLYGGLSKERNGKQQMMIDGKCTCGYREYAKMFGCIIYLSRQDVKCDWEYSMTDAQQVIDFCKKHPEAIVWSVKHDPKKDVILKAIPNKTVYYSCCNRNMYNNVADVSLVDTPARLRGNAKIHIKGKDKDYWWDQGDTESIYKPYDYMLVGKRGDKNEAHFINELTDKVKGKRSVLWVGGTAHKNRIKETHHNVDLTNFGSMEFVALSIPLGKIGILFTEHPAEGFPQTFLEMTMCGLPTIYNISAPINQAYFYEGVNTFTCKKKHLIAKAEYALKNWSEDKADMCREFAAKNYSLQVSWQNIKNHLGVK